MVVLLYEELFAEVQLLDVKHEERFKQAMVESVGWSRSDPADCLNPS